MPLGRVEVAVTAADAGGAEDLETSATTILSPAPAALSATSASAEVSYVPGEELIAAAMTSSESPALIILMTPSLFSVCWAVSREPIARNTTARKLFRIHLSLPFKGRANCFWEA